jgi:myo-inositol-1-phosphate synthase
MEKIEQLKVIREKISQNVVRCQTENKFLEKDDFMWDSISVDAIKNIDEREKKLKEEISKYAQELRDNIEKNKSKNKHMIAQMAKEIDKTRNTLEDQQEKIQSGIESTKATIIFAVAAEHGGCISQTCLLRSFVLKYKNFCQENNTFLNHLEFLLQSNYQI